MLDWTLYLHALAPMAVFALAGWLVSIARHNVTLVDSMWSLFLLLAAWNYLPVQPGIRSWLVLGLVAVWALRLCVYLTWRNRGGHEDHRYQQIRRNNQPYFWFKSLYIVFGLQLLLAWIISLPLLGAMQDITPLGWLDLLGVALLLLGFSWESLGDWQLARFKAKPNSKGQVMQQGLWRYSRHPNYFGECCIWWGFYFMALAAGAWWALPGPLLMTLLLLKVSGVALLEKDIGERRPAYAEYAARTNAFLPGPPRPASTSQGASR